MKFSVVTSVYKNDNPEFVARALDSITCHQTCMPDEVVLVVDGPIPEKLKEMLIDLKDSAPYLYNIIWLSENKGLGNALKIGVEKAKYPIIARMDSDDVSVPDRFEKQINYLETHPECDIVGSQMTEFINDEKNIVGTRKVPLDDAEIKKYLRSRCPMNHVTICARKAAILSAGNYIDWHFNEDYYLWIRMTLAGCKFANLPEVMVNVRVGRDMYARRGGWKYFRSEAKLQRYMLEHQLISRGGILLTI